MANLPLTGSQYWGAALNNYLRQLSTDIDDLKIQLANFTVAASYSGSGWADHTYTLSDLPATAQIDGNAGVYRINDTFTAKIIGTLIFTSNSGTQSVTMEATSDVRFTFDLSEDDTTTMRVVQSFVWDEDAQKYIWQVRGSELSTFCPTNGFYPIYIVNDETLGFKLGIVGRQEFIFNENYVLFGILQRSSSGGGTPDFRFIKKTDSAFKSIFDTRRENLTSYATIMNATGLFTNSTDLKINLGSLIVDYQSNGISGVVDDASAAGSVGASTDYKLPYDYKRFGAGSHRCYKISYTAPGATTISETWTEISAVDKNISDMLQANDTTHIYGVYMSVGGDLFIEESAQAYASTESLLSAATSTAWNLNANTAFRMGGLVLLGAYYYDASASLWKSLQAASNSISPEFITNRYVENSEIIRWPSVHYSTNVTASKGVVGGTLDTFKEFQYEVLASSALSDVACIKMAADFAPTEDGTTGKKYYELPIAPDQFYDTLYNNDASFKGIGSGGLQIYSVDSAKKGSIIINDQGQLVVYSRLISTTADSYASDYNLTDYINVLRNTKLVGNVAIDVAGGSFSVDGDIALSGNILKTTDKLTISAPGITLSTTGTDPIELAGGDLGVKISGSKGITSTNLTIHGDTLKLSSNNNIELNKSLTFTSDRRCKSNIVSLRGDRCLEAVKNIDAKQFVYRHDNTPSLGVIAQDIEQYLPEYKELLVDIVADGEIADKRTVAETKLLFILWQAVRELVSRED